MDGQSLGMKRGRARGTIGVVGNSRGCRVSWGTLAMFHACVFSFHACFIVGLTLQHTYTVKKNIPMANILCDYTYKTLHSWIIL